MTAVPFPLRRRLLATFAALAALSGSVVAADHGAGWTSHSAGKTTTSGKKCPGGRFNPDGTCAGPIHT